MIRIGIVLPVTEHLAADVEIYAAAGFETVSFFVWEFSAVADLADTLSRACEAAARRGITVSSLSVYGNPLRDDETGESVKLLWQRLVDDARRLGVPLVTGFAGRVVGTDVENSLPAWREFFAPLSEKALGGNIQLAFENCRIGDTWKTGKWNIAINPDAWERMFTVLDAPNIGLEWEPCHQLESLADPYRQLEAWAPRVFHVHGKDAKIDGTALAERGFYAKTKWHRSVLPGQGDSDWSRLLSILAASGYSGSIDIENPSIDKTEASAQREEEIKSLSYIKLARNSL